MKGQYIFNPEIQFLGDLQRLELRPGDRYVLMCPDAVSEAMKTAIQGYWRQFIGNDTTPLLILPGVYKLGVIAPIAPVEEPVAP